ncbi:MAG TPA: hypothetical protein VIU15_10335 [Streptomyces sp.]
MGAATSRHVNILAGWGLGLLLPMNLMAYIGNLTTERGSACLTYGVQCSTLPHYVLPTLFLLALTAGITALVWPRAKAPESRSAVVAMQWVVQMCLTLMILTGV